MIYFQKVTLTPKLLTNIGRYGCLVTNEVIIQGIDELDVKTLRKIISYFAHVKSLTINIEKEIGIDGCTIRFDKSVDLNEISLRSHSTKIILEGYFDSNSPKENFDHREVFERGDLRSKFVTLRQRRV